MSTYHYIISLLEILKTESNKSDAIQKALKNAESDGIHWEHFCGLLARYLNVNWEEGTEWDIILSLLVDGAEKKYPIETEILKKRIEELESLCEKYENKILAVQIRRMMDIRKKDRIIESLKSEEVGLVLENQLQKLELEHWENIRNSIKKQLNWK